MGPATNGSVRVVIGLGANLGDREAMLDRALACIGAIPGVATIARSRWRETDPVGGPEGQPAYLNGAVLVETDLALEQLVARLLDLERALGRTREGVPRFGPRTIDLDVLIADGGAIVSTPTLTVPHPRLRERIFALEPLVEVWPEARDPRDGVLLADVLARLLCAARHPDTMSP